MFFTVYIPLKKKYVHFFGACSIHYILYYRLHMFLTFGIQVNKGNNKITELRTILQRESQNSY